MPILYKKFISREDVRNNPEKIYVFGDNDKRRGYGGQAKQMRGEPNTIGIRVKKAPSNYAGVYYIDDEIFENIRKIDEDIDKIISNVLLFNGTIVLPEDGIGTGLARLKEFAPKTLEYLNFRLSKLK